MILLSHTKHWIIHIFAVAHALTVLLLNLTNSEPGILLTILTIVLILCIARIHNFPLDIAAAIALLCCFAGFFLGTQGSYIISLLMPNLEKQYVEATTTFMVTEIIGWLVYFITRRLQKSK